MVLRYQPSPAQDSPGLPCLVRLPQQGQELKAVQVLKRSQAGRPKGRGAAGCVPEPKGHSFEPELNQRPKDGRARSLQSSALPAELSKESWGTAQDLAHHTLIQHRPSCSAARCLHSYSLIRISSTPISQHLLNLLAHHVIQIHKLNRYTTSWDVIYTRNLLNTKNIIFKFFFCFP